MESKKLVLTIEGLPEDNGHIRAHVFVKTLQSFIGVVNRTDNLVTRSKQQSFYLRVIGLSHNSPATVVMEAIQNDITSYITIDERATVFKRMIDNFRDIQDQKDFETVDYGLLEAIQRFVSPIGKTIALISVSADNNAIDITPELQAKIDLTMSAEDTFPGEFRGTLEYLDLHGQARVFRIYPDIGPNRINCYFPDDLTGTAINAIRKVVEVRGTVKQKKAAWFPHEILVDHIDIFPPEDELPTLTSLCGIAPNATNGMTSEEFIWSIRGA